MLTKKCSKCQLIHKVEDFHKDKTRKDGLSNWCKFCKSQHEKVHKRNRTSYMKQYRQQNLSRIKEVDRKRYLNNIDKIKQRNLKHYYDNKSYYSLYQNKHRKKYYQKYKNKITKLMRQKYHSCPVYRINCLISSQISLSLKKHRNKSHWETLLDFNLMNLMDHLEKQFDKKMTWNNCGKWHVDHIIPRSLFKFESYNDIDFKLCWSLDNLQPLWGRENCQKGKKIKYIYKYKDKLPVDYLKLIISASENKKLIDIAKTILKLK